jgi:hypothetical protein
MELDEQPHGADNRSHRGTHSGPAGPPDSFHLEQVKRSHPDVRTKSLQKGDFQRQGIDWEQLQNIQN